MKQERFYGSEEPLADNLNNITNLLNESIAERQRDFTSYGLAKTPAAILVNGQLVDFGSITEPFAITAVQSSPAKVTVEFGVGYNELDERIIIYQNSLYDVTKPNLVDSEGNPTPQSTGNQLITLTSNTTNYIYIQYLQTVDTTEYFVDPDTGKRSYTKLTDGYKIVVLTTGNNIPPQYSQYLGSVQVDINGVIIQGGLSMTGRTYAAVTGKIVQSKNVPVDGSGVPTTRTTAYPADTYMTTEDHVRAVGTGRLTNTNPHAVGIDDVEGLRTAITIGTNADLVLQNHQKEEHTNGIVSAIKSPTSGLSIALNTQQNYVLITPLDASESFFINGFRVDSTNIFSSEFKQNDVIVLPHVSFDLSKYPGLVAGTYLIFLRRTVDPESGTVTIVASRKLNAVTLDDNEFLVATVYFNGAVLIDGPQTDERLFGNLLQEHVQVSLSGAGPSFILPGMRIVWDTTIGAVPDGFTDLGAGPGPGTTKWIQKD